MSCFTQIIYTTQKITLVLLTIFPNFSFSWNILYKVSFIWFHPSKPWNSRFETLKTNNFPDGFRPRWTTFKDGQRVVGMASGDFTGAPLDRFDGASFWEWRNFPWKWWLWCLNVTSQAWKSRIWFPRASEFLGDWKNGWSDRKGKGTVRHFRLLWGKILILSSRSMLGEWVIHVSQKTKL